MHPVTLSAAILLVLHIIAVLGVLIRVLLRPHRQAASRIAWIVVVLALPMLGVLAYLLLGETNIGKKRVLRMKAVISRLPDAATIPDTAGNATMQVDVSERCAHLFRAGKTVNGFMPVGGNRATLMENSNTAIDAIVADIDGAKEHVHLLKEPILDSEAGFPAQVIGTGPTVRYSAMPEIFETLIYAAHSELVISTPYYVPDDPMQAALCACARRGVDTVIIFPARNDSWIVGAASRSYYEELLEAGVRIYEYEGGLLHTKSLTIDKEITLIGSANMDRRSFELNYENNILFYDGTLTAEMRERQAIYIASSRRVSQEMVENWDWKHRLWNNAVAMLGPVL